jgi:hypothetical protein
VSSRDRMLTAVFPVAPGCGFVVRGAGLQASVQDADEPVGQPPGCVVVLNPAGAEVVVEGAGAGRGTQRGEGLGHERVDQPVVVDEPGSHDFLLARRAGNRGRGGVVPAPLAAGIPVRVVAEFAEHPGAEDGTEAGLGPVDLSVRVRAKMGLHLPLQDRDLLVQGRDHRDQRSRGGGVGGGRRLAQLLAAQRREDRVGLAGDIPATGALERGADLSAGQPGCPGRVRGPGVSGPITLSLDALGRGAAMTATLDDVMKRIKPERTVEQAAAEDWFAWPGTRVCR